MPLSPPSDRLPLLPRLRSADDLDRALAELSWIDAESKRVEAACQKEISAIKARYQEQLVCEIDDESLPLVDRRSTLAEAVEKFAAKKRDALLDDGKKSLRADAWHNWLAERFAGRGVSRGRKRKDFARKGDEGLQSAGEAPRAAREALPDSPRAGRPDLQSETVARQDTRQTVARRRQADRRPTRRTRAGGRDAAGSILFHGQRLPRDSGGGVTPMTLSDVLGLLNLFGIVIGFGAAAYKLGRWNQSIEAKLAEHEERGRVPTFLLWKHGAHGGIAGRGHARPRYRRIETLAFSWVQRSKLVTINV